MPTHPNNEPTAVDTIDSITLLIGALPVILTVHNRYIDTIVYTLLCIYYTVYIMDDLL